MTSASLKVINPPTFPLSSLPTKRKAMVAGAFIGTLLFILGVFLFIELLDRTLRDRFRARRITGSEVLGAFPRKNIKKYGEASRQKATQHIANKLYGFFSPTRLPNIINLMSKGSLENIEISKYLADYWRSLGIGVQVISNKEDFEPLSREFLFTRGIENLQAYDGKNKEVVIVNHASIVDSPVPITLLKEAAVNLLILRADGVWTDSDQLYLDDLKKQAGDSPVLVCLAEADRTAVEDFTGLLPPYTRFRKFGYRYNQFGFTSAKGK
jgi:hypothetical protein